LKKIVFASLVVTGLATAASASTVSVQYFNGGGNQSAAAIAAANTAFTALLAANPSSSIVVEDFEDQSSFGGLFERPNAQAPDNPISSAQGAMDPNDPNRNFGEIDDVLTGTAVGSFTTLGGTGNGTTCAALSFNGPSCDNIALQFAVPTLNGQANIIPDGGMWSLNSNDTLGIAWTVNTGRYFDEVIFALRDPGDQGARRLTIFDGQTKIFDSKDQNDAFTQTLGNNDVLVVHVAFASAVQEAFINIETSSNDGFTFDGAAVNVVPLPAGIWMLLAGIGGFAALKRRKMS
jgi:hypothetical protein